MKQILRAVATRAIATLETRRREIVRAHVRGRLLDIGCGENRLVRQYGNGIGVDVVDWGDVDLVVNDSAHLPFPDASFDTISFVACLNHIPHREETLKEARRLLKHDGLVLITMIPPLISAIWHRLVRRWDADQSHRHSQDGEVWGFTSKEMTVMLKRNGFGVIAHERFIAKLNNLFIVAKTLGPVAVSGPE